MSEHAASSGAAGETQPRPRHAEFYSGYVWAALALALGVGFALGAHMAMVLGLGLPLGRGFASFVQTHGHVQLVGWTGLFVMGVSLYFVPRMAGVPLAQPQWPTLALWLVAGGLGLRSIGQALAPYLVGKPALVPALWLAAASGVLEAAGILLYVVLLLRVVAAAVHPAERPGLLQVRPYFALMLSGWVLYALLNAALLVAMAAARQVVVAPAWNRLAIEIFLGFVLLPVALGVSVRTFPLYLRLPAPTWPVRGTAYVYAVALLLQLLPALPGLPALPTVAALGLLLRGGVLLWFVWQLDVLTRRRPPWTVQRKLHPGPQRRPTRPGLARLRGVWPLRAAAVRRLRLAGPGSGGRDGNGRRSPFGQAIAGARKRRAPPLPAGLYYPAHLGHGGAHAAPAFGTGARWPARRWWRPASGWATVP
ncbi:MAG: hypothetical protein KatS3mg131_3604 [Candidatus Tectimicrobiota bacterium]|nr:MAG: hypothetical protein KatS3mg131_3604 [Candidatus Tectomicrobia bacterium]